MERLELTLFERNYLIFKQINRIQQETGCRVQIVPNSTGGSERPCTLTGTFHQVHHAKQKLNEIITRGGPRENGMSYGENKHQGQVIFYINFNWSINN